MKDDRDETPRKNFEGLLGTILAVPKAVLDVALAKDKSEKKKRRDRDKDKNGES